MLSRMATERVSANPGTSRDPLSSMVPRMATERVSANPGTSRDPLSTPLPSTRRLVASGSPSRFGLECSEIPWPFAIPLLPGVRGRLDAFAVVSATGLCHRP